ncbi:nucleotidyl transferase AbiEii/AbiGii toxin family protein [Streptomyces violaceusniger]|uniref:Nucleotidyl transferase AbiEii toxin, Type IV TA system n=1 Tax=Streptomyces violaceusniger TaxID=68280 RepID=A0A4D4L9G0_STRVO|nr:hypothetical protein SVIO_058800 [Streptomyces violaceusniger]
MDDLHRQLIRIGLDALAEDYGYALAGGYAVQTHHIVNRVSDDVDLFAPFERASREMEQAAERIITAYETAGYTVEQRGLSRGASGHGRRPVLAGQGRFHIR